ncbi:MAG: cytochrome c3 family protein [Desulfamplus sp.]|nr:cytochrome c3 family protein [Desulfamplus sp.]MBF0412480.1 cytochrome c3 family protein [Desulfamplus sp.]
MIKINRTNFSIIIMVSLVFFAATLVIAAEKRGGETLKVDGGSKGTVTFPHKAHQDGLKDCNICHAVFPQELGVIKNLKDKKELEKKQVMNEVCIKCHKDYKTAGKAYGPTNCNGCHGK